jgi:hypothetical protein
MSSLKQVQMPHSFFRKSKAEYRDFRFSMIRELLQNSYDAQAEAIAFSVRGKQGNITLVCEDDGVGMDRDTLENVLLCLGGTKKFDGAIGGKGWAKQILFFAHRGYTIHSQDNLVTGCGGSYEIGPIAYRQGTAIEVELDDDDRDAEEWQDIIRDFAATCYMEFCTGRAVNITLDGEVLEQNIQEYEVNLEHEIGAVWYNERKGWSRSSFVVCVGGLPMFVETVFSNSDECALEGGVELAAGSAALTANRDGFAGDIGDEFTQLISGLVQDQKSLRLGRAMELSINFDSMTALPGTNVSDGGGNAPKCILGIAADSLADGRDAYRAALERIDVSTYARNFHIKVESLAARRSAKTEAYITASALVAEMNKQRSVRLARSWRAAVSTILNCQWALENDVVFYDGLDTEVTDWQDFDEGSLELKVFFQGRRVDVGFCFIAETAGLCSTVDVGDQPHRIFINPLLLTGDTAFRAGDTLDLAYHEVAHLWERNHGEAFCRVEGKLRQSVRRWINEKNIVTRITYAQKLKSPPNNCEG